MFVDKMSWDILTIKEMRDEFTSKSLWEPVSSVFLLRGQNKYLAARAGVFLLLDAFVDMFGERELVEKSKELLGEEIISSDSVDLFFDFCFILLEYCEARLSGLSAIEMFSFEMTDSLSVREIKGKPQ
jgi:hypothetical protein